MAFTVIWRTFAATMDGWNRGNKFIEQLHHGDFVVEQLVSSLRSAAYFKSKPEAYGFWLESRGGSMPRDKFSWVTSSSAFVGPRSPFAGQLHRLEVTIDDGPNGEGFTARAWPQLADLDEVEPEEWTISTKVKGLMCEVYDWENETWDTKWEDTNSLPSLLRVTVYLEPVEKYGEPMKLSRLVEIPIAAATNSAPINESGGNNANANANQAQNPNNNGAPAQNAPNRNQGQPRVEMTPKGQ